MTSKLCLLSKQRLKVSMSCSLVGITVVLLLTMSWFSLGRLRGANPSVAQVGQVKIVSTGGGRGVVEEEEEDYMQEQALQFLHIFMAANRNVFQVSLLKWVAIGQEVT